MCLTASTSCKTNSGDVKIPERSSATRGLEII